jgi:7-keto-8-aminopelargonate synthetase-like enzyme
MWSSSTSLCQHVVCIHAGAGPCLCQVMMRRSNGSIWAGTATMAVCVSHGFVSGVLKTIKIPSISGGERMYSSSRPHPASDATRRELREEQDAPSK